MFRNLIPLLLFCSLASAKVTLEVTQKHVALHGTGWSYKYGSGLNPGQPVLVDAGQRAWFGRAFWLRQIDTKTGNVMGRWRMPGTILDLKALDGGKLQVTYTPSAFTTHVPKQLLIFDPTQAQRFRGNLDFISTRFQQLEAEGIPERSNPFAGLSQFTATDAVRALEELKPTLERDSHTPWLTFTQARLLRASGAPDKASGLFAEVLQHPNVTFAELLTMSAELSAMGEPALSEKYFQAAYKYFLLEMRDARLPLPSLGVVSRMTTAPPADAAQRQTDLERAYLLNPHLAKLWKAAALERERAGDAAGARKWNERFAQAKGGLATFYAGSVQQNVDIALLIFVVSVVTALMWVISRLLIYGPDLYSSEEEAPEFEFLGVSRLPFWSRAERFALLALVAAAWVGLGYINLYTQASMRVLNNGEVGFGSVGGEAGRAWLERFPESAERQLLLALNAQQSGDAEKAVSLYRALPDSPVAQNNLGVALKALGDGKSAGEAFEHAKRLSQGKLSEAEFNTTGSATDFWTETHRKYAPDTGMIAVPDASTLRRAMFGGARGETRLLLLGPLGYSRESNPVAFARSRPTGRWSNYFWKSVAVLVVLAAIAINLLPRRKPGRSLKSPRRMSLIVPGTFASYGAFGAATTWIWVGSVVWLVLRGWNGTVFLFDRLLTGNYLFRQFGFEPGTADLVQRSIEPPIWPAMFLVVLLWVGNFVLVRRSTAAAAATRG